MITHEPAARLPLRALSLAAGALLLASLPLLAGQEGSRPSDSRDMGPAYEATFEPSSEPSMPSTPSEPIAPSAVPPQEPILLAQERSRPNDSSDTGRTAHEVGSHSSPPSSSSASSGGSSSSSGSSGSGRTARPSGDNEPHRQPPSRGGHGSRGHHGGGGGYYYPYGYYGPYGFWPGFSWWWGGWWGWDYPYYPYGRYGYERGPGYYGRSDVGALDLDVSPGRTEVYLDGQYIGKVDGFDGWPRYLWLPKGTYDLVFYLDGFKTISRQISVYPGSVIDVDDRMEPGESVRPENIATKSHERRDERLRYERERRERIERGERGDDDEDWRDRVRRERDGMRGEDRYDDEDIDVQDSGEKGRLRLDVEPEDASVYLDGRFVGTGSELGMMRGGLPVSPGEHKLAVVRPGRKAEERNFEVEAGEEVELEIDLETGR